MTLYIFTRGENRQSEREGLEIYRRGGAAGVGVPGMWDDESGQHKKKKKKKKKKKTQLGLVVCWCLVCGCGLLVGENSDLGKNRPATGCSCSWPSETSYVDTIIIRREREETGKAN